jgi:amino acid transporter
VDQAPQPARFRTFQGVYRPTFLTILGALFYLREGWLVGSLGLVGALAIIAIAHVITGTTAASLASIATNTRVKAGGAFAIIANALGLEAGGAIAMPLYIAQTASSAMYLYAFTEVWTYLFPTHNPWIVVAIAFVGVGAIAAVGATWAFRAQAVMLGVVALALTSAFGGFFSNPLVTPTAFGSGAGVSPLTAFAIFFPAATGIMVGVGMSGSLISPRKSIPVGTLAAWASGLAIYGGGAFLYALIATPAELVENKTILFDRALWGPLVIFGVLTSTLMAAMSSLVAAPQLLQAMAKHDVVPAARWLERTTATGDPRNASLVTLALAAVALASGSLDAIAPVITSFFLVTYLAVNGVVLLEQRLGMISFRPTFRVPRVLPLVGSALCLIALVLTSPGGGLVELLIVGGIYAWLTRRQLATPWETTRSGIGVTIAAAVATRFGQAERGERAWRPDLCVLADDPASLARLVGVARGLTHRSGSAVLVGLGDHPELADGLHALKESLVRSGMYARWVHLHRTAEGEPIARPTLHRLALDALYGAMFPPNLVLVDAASLDDAELSALVAACEDQRRGLAVLVADPQAPPITAARDVTVWVGDRSPTWEIGLRIANLDLPLLAGMLLATWRDGRLRLATAVADPEQIAPARAFLDTLVELGRLPGDTERRVAPLPFAEALEEAPAADVTLLGLPLTPRVDGIRAIRDRVGGTCMFLKDSGRESVLA